MTYYVIDVHSRVTEILIRGIWYSLFGVNNVRIKLWSNSMHLAVSECVLTGLQE